MTEISKSPLVWIFIVLVVACTFIGTFAFILGYIFALFGKEETGSRFIRFGAGCGVVAFTSMLAAAADIFLGVLVVYYLIWLKMRKSKISLCPHCGTKITALERGKLIRLFGLRKPMSCPSCSNSIVLSKWPWRIALAGVYLFPILLVLRFSKVHFGYMQNVIFYVPIILMLIGHFALKLEEINSKA